MAWAWRWTWLWIACCASLPLWGQQANGLILHRADSLAQAGQPLLALHEMDRFTFYGGRLDAQHEQLRASCLFQAGRLRESINAWLAIGQRMAPSPTADSAYLSAAVAAHLLGAHAECISHLERFSPASRDPDNYLGATLLKAVAMNAQGKFKEGQALMHTLSGLTQMQLASIDSAYRRPLRFRPHRQDVALAMSVILPGSGQAYAGKPFDGFISLVLTGGTAGLGVYSFTQGHYFFTFITCVLLFQRFYEGGARYAMKLAQQRTEDRKVQRIKAINGYLLEGFMPD